MRSEDLVVDIEVARAQGLYPLAKALIAKLVKKNASESQVLDAIVNAETDLACMKDIKCYEIPHVNVCWKVDTLQLNRIAKSLTDVIDMAMPSLRQQIEILLARVYIDHDSAKALKQLPISPSGGNRTLIEAIYYVQSLTIAAIALADDDKMKESISKLKEALEFIQNYQAPVAQTVSNKIASQFTQVIESDRWLKSVDNAVYYLIVNLKKVKVSTEDISPLLQFYLTNLHSFPHSPRKIYVLKHYFETCSTPDLAYMQEFCRLAKLLAPPLQAESELFDQDRRNVIFNVFSLFLKDLSNKSMGYYHGLLDVLYSGTVHFFQSLAFYRYIVLTFYQMLIYYRDYLSESDEKEMLGMANTYITLYFQHLNFEEERSQKLGTYFEIVILGENLNNVVQVLSMAIRFSLCLHGGDEQLLKKAVKHGELLKDLIEKYGSKVWNAQELAQAKAKAFQYLGLSLGELALEVSDYNERRNHQIKAVEFLLKSAELKQDWIILYQVALQQAETGQIVEAIKHINKSLSLNPKSPSSWNLLALCLSAQKSDQAITVCQVGKKQCQFSEKVHHLKDLNYVHDILNLKMTAFALELSRSGPLNISNSLQEIFQYFHHSFGSPPTNADTFIHSINQHLMETSKMAEKPPAVERSSSNPLVAEPTFFSNYNFQMFDMLIQLWLTASTLYRFTNSIDDALSAVEEAERIFKLLVTLSEHYRCSVRKYSKAHHREMSKTFKTAPSLTNLAAGANSDSREGAQRLEDSSSFGAMSVSEVISTRKFGFLPKKLRRILADIAFDKCIIEYSKFQLLQQKGKVHKYMRLLSVIRQTDTDDPYLLKASNSYMNLDLKRGFSSSSVPNGLLSSDSQASIKYGEDIQIDSGFVNVLESLTYDAQLITFIDDHHFVSRVHLAHLYNLQEGEDHMAKFHLERVLKKTKGRGGSGGNSGMGTSVFGGVTGPLGRKAWELFSRVSQEGGVPAFDYLKFAVELDACTPVRGFECLKRCIWED